MSRVLLPSSGEIEIPPWVDDLASFRHWVDSGALLEKLLGRSRPRWRRPTRAAAYMAPLGTNSMLDAGYSLGPNWSRRTPRLISGGLAHGNRPRFAFSLATFSTPRLRAAVRIVNFRESALCRTFE